jgi:ArsR family transcriptional regulator, arsenate/arsenite/antimonite-responsive transcriptional repressor
VGADRSREPLLPGQAGLDLAAEPGACDFTEFFNVSQPTISAHLKVLREAGLVTTQRRGTTICYSIAPGPLARLGQRLHSMAITAPVRRT